MIQWSDIVKWLAGAAVWWLVLATGLPGPPEVGAAAVSRRALARDFARGRMQFSEREWRLVLSGQAVARQLDMATGQDVAVFGIVRIQAPAARIIDHLRDIAKFERALGMAAAGLVPVPASVQAFRDASLAPADMREVGHCERGDCAVQLSAAEIARVRALDRRAPTWSQAVHDAFRLSLYDRLAAYQARGLAGLGSYDDRQPPTDAAADARAIVTAHDTPWRDTAPLLARLAEYPARPAPGTEEFFYWNTGTFGLKMTTRLNHLLLQAAADPRDRDTGLAGVAITRQIYATHYFSATLEWRTIVEDDDPSSAFLLYATRSRVSGLTGFIGALARSRVRSRARDGMARYLAKTRTVLESKGPAGGVTPAATVENLPGDSRATPLRLDPPRQP